MVKYLNKKSKRNVPYTIYQHEESVEKLAVILPGKGYNAMAPLLFYSTGLMYNKGFDVLHINYEYSDPSFSKSSLEDQLHYLLDDVDSVISELKNHQYTQFYLIGKSIGTFALSHLIKQEIFTHAKVVWFTPLLTNEFIFNSMLDCKNPSVVFIGDKDPYYDADRFVKLFNNQSMSVKLIKGVNHSLEVKDPLESIDVLKKIIAEIDLFTEI